MYYPMYPYTIEQEMEMWSETWRRYEAKLLRRQLFDDLNTALLLTTKLEIKAPYDLVSKYEIVRELKK
jgi:hypothetical protein